MGYIVKAAICPDSQLQTALDRYYPEDAGESISGLIDEISSDETFAKFEGRGASIDLDVLRNWPIRTPSRNC